SRVAAAAGTDSKDCAETVRSAAKGCAIEITVAPLHDPAQRPRPIGRATEDVKIRVLAAGTDPKHNPRPASACLGRSIKIAVAALHERAAGSAPVAGQAGESVNRCVTSART